MFSFCSILTDFLFCFLSFSLLKNAFGDRGGRRPGIAGSATGLEVLLVSRFLAGFGSSGGTVYQAFLSALSYHRWNSPVTGVVRKAYVINGSYYLENRYKGFINPQDADPSAPNDSQPFLTAVATRAVIFIEADNPTIGLMCFIAVGMAEVSSCEITVAEGQHLEKGQELGMFHFGGSTHCLVFGPHVNLTFDFHNTCPGLNATNIPVRSRIATVTT